MQHKRWQRPFNLATSITQDRLFALPLLVLYLTDGCNSRCAMCDIWHRPRRNMSDTLVDALLAEVDPLGISWVLLSGGEAMQHPEWHTIARRFREKGVRVMLLTNGLLVRRQWQEVIANVDDLIVSLDAADATTYEQIRGVDAFDLVLDGIRLAAEHGLIVTTRTTVQRANYHQIPDIARVALDAGATHVSFLPIDVSSDFAFGERDIQPITDPNLLTADDTDILSAILDEMAITFAREFADGRLSESPTKLRRTILNYFRAWHQQSNFIAPPCNAPHLSVVVEVDGTLRPCYFLPAYGKHIAGQSLQHSLNEPLARQLRRAYRLGRRDECQRCVCPLHKSSTDLVRM